MKDATRSSTKKVRVESKKIFGSGEKVEKSTEEEESMDYNEVLVTSRTTTPKPPQPSGRVLNYRQTINSPEQT